MSVWAEVGVGLLGQGEVEAIENRGQGIRAYI